MKLDKDDLFLFRLKRYDEYKNLRYRDFDGSPFGCLTYLAFVIIGLKIISHIPDERQELFASLFILLFAYPAIIPILICAIPVLNKLYKRIWKSLLRLFYKKSLKKLEELKKLYHPKEEEIKSRVHEYLKTERAELVAKFQNKEKTEEYHQYLKLYKNNLEYIQEAHQLIHLYYSDFIKIDVYLVNAKELLRREKERDNQAIRKIEPSTLLSGSFKAKEELREAKQRLKDAVENNNEIEDTSLQDRDNQNIEIFTPFWDNLKAHEGLREAKQRLKDAVVDDAKAKQDENIVKGGKVVDIPSQLSSRHAGNLPKEKNPNNYDLKKNQEVSPKMAKNDSLELNSNPQLTLGFESDKKLILQDIPPVKAKRSVGKEITVAAKVIDWNKVNIEKAASGKIGEQIVVKYEEERLKSIGLQKLTAKIEHSSIEKGDGLGYDVLSFNENGEFIYIEVKTTTGGFWSHLVFTKNEIEFMNNCGELYRLYRVFELDKEKKVGKLCIFDGSKSVNEFFDFIPQSYSAKPK